MAFMILLTSLITYADVVKYSEKYKYIEIEECFIPISIKSELLRKDSEYEYKFYLPIHEILRGISIKKTKTDTYKNFLNSIRKVPNIILVDEVKKSGFKVIIFQFKNNILTDKLYILIGNKSTIMMNEFESKEVDYLIDYCEQTKK